MGGVRTACDHERVVLAALLGAQRDTAGVEHQQDVRERELELQREADHVELRQRSPALERAQPLAVRAELALHVGPRRIAALGDQLRVGVDDGVQDLEAEVAHAHVVDVGEGEAERAVRSGPIFDHLAVLPTDIAGWLRHAVQKGGVRMFADRFRHAGSRAAASMPRYPSRGP
jgi:hypothetical protein